MWVMGIQIVYTFFGSLYIYKCQYEIQEQKKVPVWYTSPFQILRVQKKWIESSV
jgi:hypothetical protein